MHNPKPLLLVLFVLALLLVSLPLSLTQAQGTEPAPTPTATATATSTPSVTSTPTATLTPSETRSPTPSPTSWSYLYGKVFEDVNGDGRRQDGEPGLAGVTVRLYEDGALAREVSTDGMEFYQYWGLVPYIHYRLAVAAPSRPRFASTPMEVTFSMWGLKFRQVDFGFWKGRQMWLPVMIQQ